MTPARRNVEDQHPTVWMGDFFDVHTETDRLEELLRHRHRIAERLRADHRPRRLVADAQQQMPTAFIGQRHAVLVQPSVIELCLCFFELQALVFGRRLAPEVDLFRCRSHCWTAPRCQKSPGRAAAAGTRSNNPPRLAPAPIMNTRDPFAVMRQVQLSTAGSCSGVARRR